MKFKDRLFIGERVVVVFKNSLSVNFSILFWYIIIKWTIYGNSKLGKEIIKIYENNIIN